MAALALPTASIDPPFNASWETMPRTIFDAAIVRFHTEAGLTGIGSGVMMLGEPCWTLLCGVTGCRPVAVMAQEHKLLFTPHTWTNGVGVAANAHLAAAMADPPFLEFPYDPPEWDLFRRDYMLTEPLKTDTQRMIVLSNAPGMGYVLDEDRLATTRLD